MSHLFIDGFERHLANNKYLGRYTYFIDQAIHLIILALVVLLFDRWKGIAPDLDIVFSFKFLLIAIAYLVCLKPDKYIYKGNFLRNRNPSFLR